MMSKLEIRKADYKSPGKKGRRGFEDLECYQLALNVMINAHEMVKVLPREEKYDLAAQIRRSSKSVTANIAEGYGRYHFLESLRYYSIARGELNETLSHFISARTLDYIDQAYFDQIYKLVRSTESALNGFMNYVRKQKAGTHEHGTRTLRDESPSYPWSNVNPSSS
jgi:four helix bundle protein